MRIVLLPTSVFWVSAVKKPVKSMDRAKHTSRLTSVFGFEVGASITPDFCRRSRNVSKFGFIRVLNCDTFLTTSVAVATLMG